MDVLALAVNCRNHYVHGTPPKADYTRHFFETVPFLTESLEFVFGTSDLMDAGWDFGAFTQQGTTMSHPFGSFLVNYAHALETLNSALPERARVNAGSLRPRGRVQRTTEDLDCS